MLYSYCRLHLTSGISKQSVTLLISSVAYSDFVQFQLGYGLRQRCHLDLPPTRQTHVALLLQRACFFNACAITRPVARTVNVAGRRYMLFRHQKDLKSRTGTNRRFKIFWYDDAVAEPAPEVGRVPGGGGRAEAPLRNRRNGTPRVPSGRLLLPEVLHSLKRPL